MEKQQYLAISTARFERSVKAYQYAFYILIKDKKVVRQFGGFFLGSGPQPFSLFTIFSKSPKGLSKMDKNKCPKSKRAFRILQKTLT